MTHTQPPPRPQLAHVSLLYSVPRSMTGQAGNRPSGPMTMCPRQQIEQEAPSFSVGREGPGG
ncbi:hypothetical protein IF1G_10084 [Cordyceps javanica]|uniref:Uncharacterized protein n=1 Tax=Cordyceps javanica TaxID=43265 RepID=A0A545UP41_9HYPO|nr:hypothetical protein IF1G_10084 [Cordyceps javanica]